MFALQKLCGLKFVFPLYLKFIAFPRMNISPTVFFFPQLFLFLLFSPKYLKSMLWLLHFGNLMDTFQQQNTYCRVQCSLNWSNRASCQTIMRVKSFRARSWRDGQTKDNQYHMMCGLESRPAPCRHNHHMPLSACLPPYSMSDTMSNSQHVGPMC